MTIEKHNISGIPVLFIYSEQTNKNKKVIWLFHKLLQSKLHEFPLAYSLAEDGNFVVALDMQGHGERKREVEDGYDFDFLIKDIYNTASDILIVLEYLRLNFPMLDYSEMTSVGVSIGASIALVSSYIINDIKKVVSLVGAINWEYLITNNAFLVFKKLSNKRHLKSNELVSIKKAKKDIENYEPLKHLNKTNLPRILFINGLLDNPALITASKEYYNKMEALYCGLGKQDYLHWKEFIGAGHYVTDEMIQYTLKWIEGENWSY